LPLGLIRPLPVLFGAELFQRVGNDGPNRVQVVIRYAGKYGFVPTRGVAGLLLPAGVCYPDAPP
jgi:hypothetical protein